MFSIKKVNKKSKKLYNIPDTSDTNMGTSKS